MSIAAVASSRAALRRTEEPAQVARVTIFRGMTEARSVWSDLERGGALMTPYQRFAFQDAWHRHVGVTQGATPLIAVALDGVGAPLMLLPLAVSVEHGMRIARFFGGKHVTFNMPLVRRDLAAHMTRADLDLLLHALRSEENSADVLALIRQPASWSGIANPLRLLPHQPSTNDCPVMRMNPGMPSTERISSGFRRRLKGKERKLQALPGYGYEIATSDASISRALDAFFALKPLRMAEQKLPNVFADPAIEAFIRDACHREVEGGRAIEIHVLRCDDEVIAMFAGVADGERFSMMFNTYTMSANAKYSPGLILMRDIIDHYAARGAGSFDLGIGSDDYKRLFCKEDEPIFDSYLPLTSRGRAAAMLMSSMTQIKRLVKHNPALMQAAHALRSALHR